MAEQAKTRPAALDGWLYLANDDLNGATQRVPETLTDADLEFHEARGWRLVDPPEGVVISTPPPAPPAPEGTEWVELVHPVTGHRHDFPNNSAAIEGANEAGWVTPNRDGSIPRRAQRQAAREQGVDVDELPSAAGDGEQDATEEPAGDAGAEETDQQAESSATTKEE